MQSCAHPARDVFTQPDQLVASLVVVPLVHGDGPPCGALYLTLESPNDFASLQAPLLVRATCRAPNGWRPRLRGPAPSSGCLPPALPHLDPIPNQSTPPSTPTPPPSPQGFINSIIPLLDQRLQTRREEIWQEARAVRGHSTRMAAAARRKSAEVLAAFDGRALSDSGCGPLVSSARRVSFSGVATALGAGLTPSSSSNAVLGLIPPSEGSDSSTDEAAGGEPRSGEGTLSGRLATVNAKRLCTQAMVKVRAPGAWRLLGGAGAAAFAARPCAAQSPAPFFTAPRPPQPGPPHPQSLEQEILYCKRLSGDGAGGSAHSGRASTLVADLVLTDEIGAGGFGKVWRGTWKKVTAAVKVRAGQGGGGGGGGGGLRSDAPPARLRRSPLIPLPEPPPPQVMSGRATEQDAMKDAVEMAVLSSIQHPNIVQVFTCLTDCVDVGGSASKSLPGSGLQPSISDVAAAAAAAAAGAPGHKSAPLFRAGTRVAPRFRRLLPFEDPEDMETCSIIVMEVGDDREGGVWVVGNAHLPRTAPLDRPLAPRLTPLRPCPPPPPTPAPSTATSARCATTWPPAASTCASRRPTARAASCWRSTWRPSWTRRSRWPRRSRTSTPSTSCTAT
jgi:hypothetical protein